MAATSPSLGASSAYGVLANTYTNTSAGTTVNGSVGFTTSPPLVPAGVHPNYGAGVTYSLAGSNQGSALTALSSQPCDFTFAPGAIDLSTDTTHGPVGVYTPGVYCSTGAMNIGGLLTLSGSGTYIFRPVGALTSTAGSVVALAGATVCDVFWTPTGPTTLGANTTFMGTVIDNSGITVGANTTWTGRALAFGGTVTTDTDTITVPTCAGSATPICPDSRLGFILAGSRGSGLSITMNTAGTQATVTFKLRAGCTDVPVTFASFQRVTPDNRLPQNLIDKAFGLFSSGVDNTLTINIASCQMQADLIWGEFNFTELNDSNFLEASARTEDWITNISPCLPPPATINVIKTVINDNGRTKVVNDFPLFVNGTPVVSGVTNAFPANASYTITETSDPNYVRTFSGDCDISGHLTLNAGDNKICIITNNDIPPVTFPVTGGGPVAVPPIIDVVKVPNPLALPNGPGSVEYTYTVRNIGTVPMTTVTMVGDTCSPIILQSGDTNNNGALDLTETWVYTCTTNLTQTTTNTITATGWANGISAVDVATAIVVVGVPGLPNTGAVPPLIHVTKVPNPLRLQVGGGLVTYTERITNPGIASLNNVRLTDDKCAPMNYISGDTNGNSLLDPNEAWTYTCSANLAVSTTNTAVATGTANGLTARDFAVVSVIVPGTIAAIIPGLPNTGINPTGNSPPWNIIVPVGIFIPLFALYLKRKKITINSNKYEHN